MDQPADTAYVRAEEAPRLPPPPGSLGAWGWLRANFFATPGSAALTAFGVLILVWLLPPLIDWAFVNAVWTGSSRQDCVQPEAGACWAYIKAKLPQFIYGRYPIGERWRVDLVFALLALGLIPMAIPAVPFKRLNALFLLVVFPVAAYVLLVGGVLGLPHVETARWGGLLVTLVVAITGMVVSLPFGVLLALGRRSRLPMIRFVSVAFIEFWRGVPLITVLFMSSVMLPIFLPPGVTFDKLLRALIGVAFFASAYMAEVVRGGLQAIPKGQYEAAMALGLGYWRRMRMIILPQALTLVIPGIVNSFIALFKDTSLVLVISIFDLLGTIQSNNADANWASPQTPATGYAFAALVYWIFCFSMSRYSIYTERRLHAGYRR